MVRMNEMAKVGYDYLSVLEMPVFDNPAWTPPAPAKERRIAIVSTAGLSQRGDKPFSWVARDYRAFDADDKNLVMTHAAVDYDRTGWQQDLNVILPLDRLREMAAAGEIGSVAEFHYSFMGAADPRDMEKSAREVAERMKAEAVDTVFLVPI